MILWELSPFTLSTESGELWQLGFLPRLLPRVALVPMVFSTVGVVSLLGAQALGVVTVGAFTFIFSLVVWYILKATTTIRVTEEAEKQGLDISEMGMTAYPEEPSFLTE